MGARWAEWELNLLRGHYAANEKELLLEKLVSRSWIQIKSKAREMGLRIVKQVAPKWKSSEERVLKRLYPRVSTKEIAEKYLPSRTVKAIESRAKKLGVRKLALRDRRSVDDLMREILS